MRRCATALVGFSLLISPLPALSDPVDPELESLDLLNDLEPMNEDVLGNERGGIDSVDISIGDIAVNAAENDSIIQDTAVNNSQTGEIANNNIQDVEGISSVMFNTGNNVSFQNNVQVNVYLE